MFHIVNDDELNKRNDRRGGRKGRGGRNRGNDRNESPLARVREAKKFLAEAEADWAVFQKEQGKIKGPGFWTMLAWSPAIGTVVGLGYLGIALTAWTIVKSVFGIN